jgi:hypothetical protein
MQYRNDVDNQRLATLRQVSELRFARDFSPETYGEHLKENRKGELEVV